MIIFTKVKKGTALCALCNEPAIKAINGLPVCPHCLDKTIVKIIAQSAKEAVRINIKFTIIPKVAKNAAKNG